MRRALAAVVLLAGCAPQTTAPPTPEQIALSAFELDVEPPAETLEALFAVEVDDRRLPDLLDTLDRLPEAAVAVVATEAANGGWWIELESDPEEGEQQSWVVQLEAHEASWRIVWLSGPDASWPRRTQPRRYTGLSVSAAPANGG